MFAITTKKPLVYNDSRWQPKIRQEGFSPERHNALIVARGGDGGTYFGRERI